MPKIADRVKETTTTTGTGTLNLGGAATGFRAFSAAFVTTDAVYYVITDGTDWEVGIGTLTTGSPWTLSRDTVLSSSNAGSKVSWAAGSKDVFCDVPASLVDAMNEIAQMFFWPHASTPSYALLCNGAAISRTTYAALFAIIGTTWGSGDGSTTFNLPNVLADQVPVQASANEGTSTTGDNKSHAHTISGTGNGALLANAAGTRAVPGTGTNLIFSGTLVIDSSGGTYALPAGIRGRWCIKY